MDRSHCSKFIDAHVHLVDFMQESDGLDVLCSQMSDCGVAKSVVFGLPVKKKWEYFEPRQPQYYLDDESHCYYFSASDMIVQHQFVQLSPANQDRIAPLLCGYNPTDMSSIRYVEHMFHVYPIRKGIGEVFFRHDDLSELIQGEIARVNHPACFPIYEFCASRDVPFLLHHNSSSKGVYLSYIHELEEVLDKFPSTTFVWAHSGVTKQIPHIKYYEVLQKLFDRYDNLMVDFSRAGYDNTVYHDKKIDPKRVECIKKYPDRCMVGSDCCGHFENYHDHISKFHPLFAHLEDTQVIDLVSHATAERLFF